MSKDVSCKNDHLTFSMIIQRSNSHLIWEMGEEGKRTDIYLDSFSSVSK